MKFRATFYTLVMGLVGLMIVGCQPLQTGEVSATAAKVGNNPSNLSFIDKDGNQSASNIGTGATIFKSDATGAWANVPGPVGISTIAFPGLKDENGETIPGTEFVLTMGTPNDGEVDEIELIPNPRPGQAAFRISGVKFNISEPLKQHAAMVASLVNAIIALPEAQREVEIKRAEEAGEITADLAAALLKAFAP